LVGICPLSPPSIFRRGPLRSLRVFTVGPLQGWPRLISAVARLVKQIRQAWPEVRIIVRGDSGFCREELMAWCEANQVDYVLGLAKNDRLRAEIAAERAQAAEPYQRTGKAARVFKEFPYQTRASWSRARRVEWAAQALYEELYCARGEMENRIKEQWMLFADRTSTAYLRSNQIRLYFSSVGYLLMQALRRLGLQGTEMAKAQCTTLRLKLLKIGALIRITVRKGWGSMAAGYPDAERFRQAYARLQAMPSRA